MAVSYDFGGEFSMASFMELNAETTTSGTFGGDSCFFSSGVLGVDGSFTAFSGGVLGFYGSDTGDCSPLADILLSVGSTNSSSLIEDETSSYTGLGDDETGPVGLASAVTAFACSTGDVPRLSVSPGVSSTDICLSTVFSFVISSKCMSSLLGFTPSV